MVAREKYSARPVASVTTFTALGLLMSTSAAASSESPPRPRSLHHRDQALDMLGPSQRLIALNIQINICKEPFEISCTRSVPERCAAEVMRAAKPCCSQKRMISSESVATMT
jgi:hypothetical protein